MMARPEATRLVAAQMTEALINAQNNKVEIALNPKELGHVRMVLSTTETGVSVSITAERLETLDMMRRHIDQLAEEFRRLGYADIGFEFSGGDARGTFDEGTGESSQDQQAELNSHRGLPEPVPEKIARAVQTRGLDLRI